MSDLMFDDFTDLAPSIGEVETVMLAPEMMQQAQSLSLALPDFNQQWSTYLSHLALLGFTTWLRQRDSQLSVEWTSALEWQARYSGFLNACLVRVQDFRVCLIPSLSLGDPEVVLPRAVVTLPEFAAHFYVAVGIEPELEMAAMQGWMSYQQLTEQVSHLKPEADWTYLCPITWFHQAPLTELLLYFRCLSPTEIPLPAVAERQFMLAQVKDSLLARLSKLPAQPLWRTLTWQQGAAVLTAPALVKWLQQPASNNQTMLSDLLQGLTQQVIDLSQWLDELNPLTAETHWQPVLASQLRGKATDPGLRLQEILGALQQEQSFSLPETVYQAYRDLELASIPIRTYSVIWFEGTEWMLLILVEVLTENVLTGELRVRISDSRECLVVDALDLANIASEYLAVQVAGQPGDLLLVTLFLDTGESVTLEPFALPSYRPFPGNPNA
jgi:hypothetical protein